MRRHITCRDVVFIVLTVAVIVTALFMVQTKPVHGTPPTGRTVVAAVLR